LTLIRAKALCLDFGFGPLLDAADFNLDNGERVCLVGRNGQGKTTLLKILAGLLPADSGNLIIDAHTRVAYLPQAVPEELAGPLRDVVLGGSGGTAEILDEYERLGAALSDPPKADEIRRFEELQEELDRRDGWNVRQDTLAALTRLNLASDDLFEELSGGRKRQCLLIRALASRPQVLLLDEPTNHLDIEAIEWLENLVRGYRGAVLFVTHDRAFLRAVASRIVDLDRGKLTSWPGDFAVYRKRKEEALEAESKAWSDFDKNLAREEVWVRQGIKARRTRNEGRVRALKQLRTERSARRDRMGQAKINIQDGQRSGKRVFEAEGLTFAWPDKPIVRDFNLELCRGDRLGIIGPNGCGKTTLLRLLLGDLAPQAGTVREGTNIKPLYFDQLRDQLEDDKTVQENLGKGDTVVVGGRPRHVIGYLSDFLFSPERARSEVRLLSGGERNRLLLAKLFIREANLLILDEPTNDLDTETLELLEQTLLAYKGTLILVCHDREFLNNVVTSCIAFDHDGEVRQYVGGYDEWVAQRPALDAPDAKAAGAPGPPKKTIQTKKKLTFQQSSELESLPKEIEALEEKRRRLTVKIETPSFFEGAPQDIQRVLDRLAKTEPDLAALYARWEALDALREDLDATP
jgi:ATP-binding cassette subfamily F protein uup